jgi:hypothetical protein
VGAAQKTLTAALVALVALASPAHADDAGCTAQTGAGERFATCFDVGNRLFLIAGTGGFGAGARVRHVVRFDDEPDLVWKLDHELLSMSAGGFGGRLRGVVYSGRYLRHARDGHIVLPLGSTPKKIFLPFDIGAEAEVGRFRGRISDSVSRLGVVRTAALIDVSRSESFRHRLSLGAVARWDLDFDRQELSVGEHVVVPFSTAVANAYLESKNGLTVAEVTVEGGTAWSNLEGWQTEVSARASLERIVIAVNDRPVSIFAGAEYRRADDEYVGDIGLRFALIQRRDRRVILSPLE